MGLNTSISSFRRGGLESWLGLTAVAVAVVLGTLLIAGGQQIGISNDEPTHQDRAQVYADTGWYLPQRFMDPDGKPDPTIERGRLNAYGATFSLTGHVVAIALGAESFGHPARTADAYAARHLAVGLLGILAAVVGGLAVASVTRSRVIGAWTTAATLAMPLWSGHAMFAIKDVPSAAGWTFFTAALVLSLGEKTRWGRTAGVGVLATAGIFYTVGVRTALWLPLGATLAAFVLAALAYRRLAVKRDVLALLGGSALGFVLVLVVQFQNARTPVTYLWSAVRLSGDFHWTGSTLTAGRLLTEKPGPWYLPAWLGASTPLLLGLLAVVGFLVAILAIARASEPLRRTRVFSDDERAAVSAVLFALQALALPTVSTVTGATMYAGLRQHLYILPALAAIAGLGLASLLRSRPQMRRVWAGVAAVALVVPAIEQIQLHPYEFTYKNALAGHIDDRWETDLHFVSAREALHRVPAGAPVRCFELSTVTRDGKTVAPTYLPQCRSTRLAPYLDEQGEDSSAALSRQARPGEIWVVARKYRGGGVLPGCREVDDVTRSLLGQRIVMSYVLLCPANRYVDGNNP